MQDLFPIALLSNRINGSHRRRRAIQKAVILLAGMVLLSSQSLAQKKYDSGASDTEVKIGQTMPYSGPLSSYSTIGKLESAYFKMLNDRGGVRGRKINFISVDDA